MTKSILNLPPILQTVWTAAYQAVVQGEHMALADSAISLLPNMNELANRAEEHAWEAVRRANGGQVPVERQCDTTEARLAVIMDAIERPCPITGNSFFMVIRHPVLGWVPTYGGPRESWTSPESDHLDFTRDRKPELYRYRYDHDTALWDDDPQSIGMRLTDDCADESAHEPTFDDMAEALAPIVAEAHYGAEWPAVANDKQRMDVAMIQASKAIADPQSLWVGNGIAKCASVAIASWKGARAWGKK